MSEKKNENEVQQNGAQQPVENTNAAEVQANVPQMSRKEGFFVKHAEQLDKGVGTALKIAGVVAGGVGMFLLGGLFARGKEEESYPDTYEGGQTSYSAPNTDAEYPTE